MNIPAVEDWSALALSDRECLPAIPGIYAVVDGVGKLYYIGKSMNLRKRWANSGHHRYPQASALREPTLRWIEVNDKAVGAVETALIRHYQPKWNNTPVPNSRSFNLFGWLNRLVPMVGAVVVVCLVVAVGELLARKENEPVATTPAANNPSTKALPPEGLELTIRGDGNSAIGAVQRGDRVTVLSSVESDGYVLIETAGGVRGWVLACLEGLPRDARCDG